jgi:hypothetical protein
MCQTRATGSHPATRVHCGCGCCGCGCGTTFRRFFSAEEKQECLEAYRDQLKKELAGVQQRINELEGK